MKYTFIGDLHLGKQVPHATRQGTIDFNLYLLSRFKTITDQFKDHTLVQMGDLFDQANVGHATFCKGLRVAGRLNHFLTGNHDFNLDLTKQSALTCLRQETEQHEKLTLSEEHQVYAVPYQPTQARFEEVLHSLEGGHILCLHAGLARGLGKPMTENNLDQGLVDMLQEKFTFILSGHEHNAHRLNNIFWTGSFMPFSFGEMTSKYVYTWDSELPEQEPVPTLVWDAKESYLKRDWKEAGALKTFIEVVGECGDQGAWVTLCKVILTLRKAEGVFAVKNSVTMAQDDSLGFTPSGEHLDWMKLVKAELNKEQMGFFEELLEGVG
jgi:hypothetical protein